MELFGKSTKAGHLLFARHNDSYFTHFFQQVGLDISIFTMRKLKYRSCKLLSVTLWVKSKARITVKFLRL